MWKERLKRRLESCASAEPNRQTAVVMIPPFVRAPYSIMSSCTYSSRNQAHTGRGAMQPVKPPTCSLCYTTRTGGHVDWPPKARGLRKKRGHRGKAGHLFTLVEGVTSPSPKGGVNSWLFRLQSSVDLHGSRHTTQPANPMPWSGPPQAGFRQENPPKPMGELFHREGRTPYQPTSFCTRWYQRINHVT